LAIAIEGRAQVPEICCAACRLLRVENSQLEAAAMKIRGDDSLKDVDLKSLSIVGRNQALRRLIDAESVQRTLAMHNTCPGVESATGS
jgi:hypothetical protein